MKRKEKKKMVHHMQVSHPAGPPGTRKEWEWFGKTNPLTQMKEKYTKSLKTNTIFLHPRPLQREGRGLSPFRWWARPKKRDKRFEIQNLKRVERGRERARFGVTWNRELWRAAGRWSANNLGVRLSMVDLALSLALAYLSVIVVVLIFFSIRLSVCNFLFLL